MIAVFIALAGAWIVSAYVGFLGASTPATARTGRILFFFLSAAMLVILVLTLPSLLAVDAG